MRGKRVQRAEPWLFVGGPCHKKIAVASVRRLFELILLGGCDVRCLHDAPILAPQRWRGHMVSKTSV